MFLCTFVHIRTFCQAPVTIEMVLASAAKLSLNEKQAEGPARLSRGGNRGDRGKTRLFFFLIFLSFFVFF